MNYGVDMGKKKKNSNVKITSETRDAADRFLNRLEPGSCSEALQRICLEKGVDPIDVIQVLGTVKTSDAADRLSQLLEGESDKKVLKAVKQALYKLEQAGFSPIKIGVTNVGTIYKTAAPRRPLGYLTPVFDDGVRFAIIAIPYEESSYEACMFGYSLFTGFTMFDQFIFSKSDLKRVIRGLVDETGDDIIEAPVAHVRYLLEEAADITRKNRNPLPEDYPDFKIALNRISAPEPSVISEFRSKHSSGDPDITKEDVSQLLDLMEVSCLLLLERYEDEWLNRLEDIVFSSIIVTEEQRFEQYEYEIERIVKELFREDDFRAFSRALEEAAFLYSLTGREQYIGKALKLSRILLEDPEDPIAEYLKKRIVIVGVRTIEPDLDITAGMESEYEGKLESGLIAPG